MCGEQTEGLATSQQSERGNRTAVRKGGGGRGFGVRVVPLMESVAENFEPKGKSSRVPKFSENQKDEKALAHPSESAPASSANAVSIFECDGSPP